MVNFALKCSLASLAHGDLVNQIDLIDHGRVDLLPEKTSVPEQADLVPHGFIDSILTLFILIQ